ncbi:hypothetical protein D3C85_958560 [compost metagenome]
MKVVPPSQMSSTINRFSSLRSSRSSTSSPQTKLSTVVRRILPLRVLRTLLAYTIPLKPNSLASDSTFLRAPASGATRIVSAGLMRSSSAKSNMYLRKRSFSEKMRALFTTEPITSECGSVSTTRSTFRLLMTWANALAEFASPGLHTRS